MRGQMDFILSAVTGTNNVNVPDDLGVPSTMVKIPKFKISDVIPGGPNVTHPMFIVNGVEKDAIYIGKYEAVVDNLRAYSLAGRVPNNKLSFSEIIQHCRNKGEGWHTMTNAEYAGTMLWSRANGTLPRGNDYKGRSNRKFWERGQNNQFTTYETPSDTEVITNNNDTHYPGEQIQLDFTEGLQSVDLTGVSQFKLDSYMPGSVDGTTPTNVESAIIDVPTGAKKLIASIKRRRDKLFSEPALLFESSINAGIATGGGTVIKFTDTDYRLIMYASSTDGYHLMQARSTDGKNWNTPTAFTIGNGGTSMSGVCDDDGTYKLWYSRSNGVYYTTSADQGATWNKPQEVYINKNQTNVNSYIIKDNGVYKMWITGNSNSASSDMSYSTSSDGITWSTPVVIFNCSNCESDTTHITCPRVYKTGDKYLMVYDISNDAIEKIAYSYSLDGITWTKSSVLIPPANNARDTLYTVQGSAILRDDGTVTIIYLGYDGTKTSILQSTLNGLPGMYENTFSLDTGDQVYTGNMKVCLPNGTTPYNVDSVTPFVLKDGDTYKMWFCGRSNSDKLYTVMYSTSTNGADWSSPVVVIKAGTTNGYDDCGLCSPWVIKDGTTYKMWVHANSSTSGSRIMYTTSTDGITWAKPTLVLDRGTNANGYDSATIANPCVIKESDTSYKMWVFGTDSNLANGRLLYSTSTDGKTWTPTVLASSKLPLGISSACVIKDAGVYRMIYEDRTKYTYLTSSDGLNWGTPVTVMTKNSCANGMDNQGLIKLSFMNDNGVYKMWFCAANSQTVTSICYRTSKDCYTWSYSPNTIVASKSVKFGLSASNGKAVVTVLKTNTVKTFIPGEKIRFNCIGEAIKFNTSNATKLKFECYGASGGDYGSYTGGAGGYTWGEFDTAKAVDLYFMVGGRGGLSYEALNMGYNGGGLVYNASYTYGSLGGGATDIRTASGDITRRLIVAGGGGTADSDNGNGGNGGGWTGGTGASTGTSASMLATGGNQSSVGSNSSTVAGYDSAGVNRNDNSCGAGVNMTLITNIDPTRVAPGGGGFYGGGASDTSGGGGGSSYVAGNVNCTYIHPDGLSLINSGTSSGGNIQKDGYIVVTVLETTDTQRYNVGDKVRFNYTGAPQTFIQGNATKVKVECYGASGGYRVNESKGGYAYGELSLAKIDVLSVLVGGMGGAGTLGHGGIGGYNGGGNGGSPFDDTYFGGCGGGGATDVRSVIADDVFNADSLASRLVVAGGGGGECTADTLSGDGGGWSGIAAVPVSTNGVSMPGAQTIGYAIGKGGNGDSAVKTNDGSNEGNGGGGGGYYGGYGGIKLNSGTKNDVSGAGGSSYVSGDANCPATQSKGITLANTGTTASTNVGDGYVIITIMEVSTDRKFISGETYTFGNINDVQNFNTKNAKRIRIECYGAGGAKADEQCGDPGKGGYVSGDLILNTPQNLQLYVGGKGGYKLGRSCGFNGGGQTYNNLDSNTYFGSGASDVRTTSDPASRILVAGAGGSSSKSLVPGQGKNVGNGITGWNGSTLAMDIGNEPHGYNTAVSSWPCTIQISQNSYIMYFLGKSNNSTTGTSLVDRLLYATSKDGINWSTPAPLGFDYTNPICLYGATMPHVIKDGSVYKMWFIGYKDPIQADVTSTRTICYASSTDGINWSNFQSVKSRNDNGTYDTCDISAPCVIKDGSTYRLWYRASDGGKVRILYTSSTDGITWTKSVLAINIGANGTYDTVASTQPWIIKDGSVYKMWYLGYRTTEADNAGKLLYTTSTDASTWTTPVLADFPPLNQLGYDSKGMYGNFSILKDTLGRYNMWYAGYDGTNYRILYTSSARAVVNPVNAYDGGDLTGRIAYEGGKDKWDALSLAMTLGQSSYTANATADPFVIKDFDRFKMWFSGFDVNGVHRIMYSTSLDGSNWDSPILAMDKGKMTSGQDSAYAVGPSVVKESDTSYKMWYESADANGVQRILYSTSTDGIHWNTPIVSLSPSGSITSVVAPHVIKESNTSYKMWFNEGNSSDIQYATSTDGITWNIVGPVLYHGTMSSKIDTKYQNSRIIKDNGIYKMWASAVDSSNNSRTVYSSSTDGINWSVPVLVIDIGTSVYSTKVASRACVVRDGDTYHMWLHGYDGTNYRMLYTKSTSTTSQWCPGDLPLTSVGQPNYGSGDTKAKKVSGASFNSLGTTADSAVTNYSSIFSPGGGGYYGGLTYNGPGEGGTSYVAGDSRCPKHVSGVAMSNTVVKPGINSGEGKIVITIMETEDTFKYRSGDKVWFKYTGAPEAFDCKNITKMHMELWGGSTSSRHNNADGGYVYGTFYPRTTNTTNLYVLVGGQGTYATDKGTHGKGGWNGGGDGGTGYSTYSGGDGGGGATDVRTVINDDIFDIDSIESRFIVAGGAGGACGAGGGYLVNLQGGGGGAGGAGGGWIGGNGSSGNASYDSAGKGGTQSTGASFGKGGNGSDGFNTSGSGEGNGGGGGGYYGGTGGYRNPTDTTTQSTDATGGGGSSFAVGDPNCPGTHPDNIVLTNTGTVTGGNDLGWNLGAAVFTVLETDSKYDQGDENIVKTGTGPASWSHDHKPTGIYDLVGNLNTLCTGLRINGATLEPQVIINNDAARADIDFSDDANWVSLGTDGTAMAKGSGVKYSNAIAGNVTFPYSSIALSSAGYVHKALGLAPSESNYDFESAVWDFRNINNSAMMNACYRGGAVGDKSTLNSIFSALFKASGNDDRDSNRGFRVCYYEP